MMAISHYTDTHKHTETHIVCAQQHVPTGFDPVYREVLHAVTEFSEQGKAFLQADSPVSKHYKTWK